MGQGTLEELIENPGSWQICGPFHLEFEKWNKLVHSRPVYSKGYGGWISIKNLPLDYWCRQTFEAIGAYFGGLEAIATDTLNLLNVFEAKIQVKKNLCGFIPSTIEISDKKRGSTFLNFGDIESIEPPGKVKDELCVKDFSNPFDLG